MAEWTRNATVAVFVITLGGALVGLYGYFGKGKFGPKGMVLHTTLRDATGLAPMGRVSMAGIPIGNIKGISLTARRGSTCRSTRA
jgi:ABC-type transporter Mla subunit MlaD